MMGEGTMVVQEERQKGETLCPGVGLTDINN